VVTGPFETEGAVLIGSLFGLSLPPGGDPAAVPPGPPRASSIALAVSEINRSGGLPNQDPCLPSRPLVHLSCDDADYAAAVGGEKVRDRIRAAKHLTDDLRVPAIIGGQNSGNTIAIAEGATLPAGALLFAPTATAISISTWNVPNTLYPAATVAGTRLVWRAAPPDLAQARGLALQVADVEKSLRAAGTATLRVAVVVKDDAFGNGVSGALEDAANLAFNGAKWNDSANAGLYLKRKYSVASDAAGQADRASAAAELRAFGADVVLLVGTNEALEVLTQLESATGPSVTKRPTYLVADGLKTAQLTAAVKANPALRQRLRGVSPGVVGEIAFDFFANRFKPVYATPADLLNGMTASYDITYMLAYAMTAAKSAPITAKLLVEKLRLLTGGTRELVVGPRKFGEGTQAMLAGEQVDFVGASGPLDLDPTLGEGKNDLSVWCVRSDPNLLGQYLISDNTTQSYRVRLDRLEGEFSCE
jgi:ABC-type branched-subunit amino acid transport system substrate-binding protein